MFVCLICVDACICICQGRGFVVFILLYLNFSSRLSENLCEHFYAKRDLVLILLAVEL